MTGLNIRDELHIHESILFGFPGRNDDAIVINYYILYAKSGIAYLFNKVFNLIFSLRINGTLLVN